jgi:hypothetical protein
MLRSLLSSPLALAVLVTAANAVKPVTVDDTAYLTYARHIASDPVNPYGFPVFWWAKPEPAMDVLCPPVIPYWLALGMTLVGRSPGWLKLWLFPFVYLLALALRALLGRFARGAEDFALPLLVLSPAVLPTVNLMLDIPAVAVGLASVELFIRGVRGRRWPPVLIAGVGAALAMQTKYTAFVAPAAMMWYGITHRRIGAAAVAVGLSGLLFVGWERWTIEKYGVSHFLHHASGAGGAPPDGANPVTAFLEDKSDLIPPLVGQLGCLAVGAGLLGVSVLRVPRPWLIGLAAAWCVGFVLVATVPRRWTVIRPEVTATSAYWQTGGWVWLAAAAGCAAALLFRVKKGLAFRRSADSWFLVGWLAIELVASVGLSPFPAARRVIGITLVLGLLAARAASRIQRASPTRRPPAVVLAIGVAAGVALAAIDTLDAFPEKVLAERGTAVVPGELPKGNRAWYIGHWGFQYYCERARLEPFIPGIDVAWAGDYVVLPVYPDDGFNRPYAGFDVREPEEKGEVVADLVWDDWLSATTVPNFYGGGDPVAGRDFPRLHVRVYRLRERWDMRK